MTAPDGTRGLMRLVLFDVDGTLVNARGAGRAAMTAALEASYGTRGTIDRYDFRGKTDLQAVFDILRASGVDEATIAHGLQPCFAHYVTELERIVGDGDRVEVLPGVKELVAALGSRDDVIVGLLTGNIEAGARVKLRSTGLWPRFRLGAFGSDDADRRRLPLIACERARAVAGYEVLLERVTIIGDTPLDIDCARACGAAAVAVATGYHRSDELSACAPDALFTDLADVSTVLASVLALTPRRAR